MLSTYKINTIIYLIQNLTKLLLLYYIHLFRGESEKDFIKKEAIIKKTILVWFKKNNGGTCTCVHVPQCIIHDVMYISTHTQFYITK